MANENKQAVVNAIWANPQPAFGCPFKQSSSYWENLKNDEYDERGKIRLALTYGGTNIRVFYNGSSRQENTDVFTYLQQYRLNTSTFGETLRELADLYGLSLEFSTDERRKMARAELARELAPSFVEALKQHPDGETARYLRDTRRLDPDGHFGELTAETLKRALAHLKNRGISYDPADIEALGLTERRAAAGYNCVVPYTVNGRVVGFLLRNIRANLNGFHKYLYSEGLGRGGYCDTLANGKPAVIVEGPMDAIRLIQQGVENVVAIGGAKIGEEIGRLLRGHNIVEAYYIPDHETDTNQRRETKLVADAIRAFQSVRVDDTPVVERLYIVDLPAPDDWTKYPKYGNDGTLKGYKIDPDTFGAEHPDQLRAAIEYGPVVWWGWELDQLTAWDAAQDGTGRDTDNEFQRRFHDIYTRCGSPYEREKIRRSIRGNDRFERHGVTPQACEHADEWQKVNERNDRVRAAASDLNRAVADQADPETVGAIVRRLNDAMGADTRDEWAAQLDETFDDELAAIQEQPDTLKTQWEVGNIDKTGKYHRYERIEFYPADIEVFCAPTSHGKTMILFQSAFDLIRNTTKTFLFVSCEENKRQLVERALNVYIDIPTTPNGRYKDANGREQYCFIRGTRKKTIKAIIRDAVAPDEYGGLLGVSDHFDAVKQAVKRQIQAYRDNVRPRLKFVHTEASAESICNNVVRFVEEYRNNGVEVGGVFVDYMQLLTTDGANYSRHDELKDICKALKDCAARIELPVVIAAQLNREVLRREVGLDYITVANIGEGADIERIAHDIYLVWQVDKTPLQNYCTTTPDGDQQLNPARLNIRSRRLFTRGDMGREGEGAELKTGYLYIEQLKARDGKTDGWGLFKFDGERGRIESIDTAIMAK